MIALLLFCFTALACAQDIIPGDKHCRASIRHIEAGGIGYKHGFTTFEGFFAPDPCYASCMPFLDVRGHVFDTGRLAANVGLGVRGIAGHRVYGGNVYYDYRDTKRARYNQIGFGFETLGRRWDFRINAYVPIERKITPICPAEFKNFSGNRMIVSQKNQFAMTGTLAELGCHFGKSRLCEFYASAGAYYFKGKIGPNVAGGKVRLVGKFTECFAVELSNSYDNMFHNRFQGQLTFTLPFGGESCGGEPDVLYSRMVQPVERQEIVVVGSATKCSVATNPATREPFRFIFVDNMSHSLGTYESPYPTLTLAQENSGVSDIIYVFPGDGSTTGMDTGITLQLNQKFWGSGVDHALATSQGTVIIPAESTSAPTITNTNVDTLGDAVTLDAANEVSGFTITSALNNGIIGTDTQSLTVSDCTILNSGLDALLVESGSSGMACTITDCTIQENVGGGCILECHGPSTLLVSENNFNNNTSVSSAPIIMQADAGQLTAAVTHNIIHDNTCGAVRCILNDTELTQLTISNNTIADNGSGSQGVGLGSPLLLFLSDTASGNGRLDVTNNSISGNGGSGLYCSHGDFNNFEVHATGNTLMDNVGGGLVFANGANTFKLVATDNIIANGGDNGISTPGTLITAADITISGNQITGNTGGGASGVAIAHLGTNLNMVINNNNISNNDGTGILAYPSTVIENVTFTIAQNTINNNQNLSSNQVGGIDLEQFTNLSGTLANNTLLNNTAGGLYVGSADPSPNVCMRMTGNTTDTGYTLSSGTGIFNITPCDAFTANSGIFNTIGTINTVQSCPDAQMCPS